MAVPHSAPSAPGGEELVLCHDDESGLDAVIAIDDTTLGPGLGGVRWMPYPSFDAAVEEARRLSRVMTLKNALADIPYGGAKAVMVREPGTEGQRGRRVAQLRAFAGCVRDLNGRYIPGVDMGTSPADLATMATVAPLVSCDEHDPSPTTALGVFHAIAATVRHVSHCDMVGVRVMVQGAGHVGAALADLLASSGARVMVADLDPARAAAVAERTVGSVVATESAHAQSCDVFAPCAQARVLHPASIDALDCAMVVGAANDMLATRDCAELMRRRGIVYVPDFVANAGGVIHIHSELARWDAATLAVAVTAIGRRTADLLAAAGEATPLSVAESWASDRLGHPVKIPD